MKIAPERRAAFGGSEKENREDCLWWMVAACLHVHEAICVKGDIVETVLYLPPWNLVLCRFRNVSALNLVEILFENP